MIMQALSARLKSCPFKTGLIQRFLRLRLCSGCRHCNRRALAQFLIQFFPVKAFVHRSAALGGRTLAKIKACCAMLG